MGFYSAFMVADSITVRTKKYGSEQAYEWQSSGADGYTITECDKEAVGTDVIMHIKPDTDEEKYSEYLESYRLHALVKKYSDYIRYPIRMLLPEQKVKEGSDPEKPEYETVEEMKTVNSMVPLWQRKKSDVTDEEYNKFYSELTHEFDKPQRTITVSAEGSVTYKALLFVPSSRPFNFYTEGYEKGLQLYSAGVLIMDKCDSLLPDYLRFVRGVVDSPDLSLNISRELLQHDRQLKVIGQNLEKKVRADLEKFLKDDREGYEKFYENFGRQNRLRHRERRRREPQGFAQGPDDVLFLHAEEAHDARGVRRAYEGRPEVHLLRRGREHRRRGQAAADRAFEGQGL